MGLPPQDILVAVVGAGGVGAHFLSQLASQSKRLSTVNVKLCYLGVIDRAYWKPDYSAIGLENALQILEKDGQDPIPLQQVIDYLAAAPSRVVVIDNTSSQVISDAYPQILRLGISIVTPNKKAFSGSYGLWEDIFAAAQAGGAFVYHECTVGAALPVLSTLRSLIAVGDNIQAVEGVFSGTMTYLFSNFSPVVGSGPGEPWSSIVRKARDLGYTEPDPRDDLNGLDIARKLTILARVIGMETESPNSFPVESLVPPAIESVSSSTEFLDQLPAYDGFMEEKRREAEQKGKVLRFVGTIDVSSGRMDVGLRELPKGHPISQLTGSDNIISIRTRIYGEQPLIVQGAGAGGEVTAMGVLSDFFHVVDRLGRATARD